MTISYAKFRFVLNPLEPLHLPVYKGSTLRGGFGNAFKSIVCVSKGKECSDCILKDRCVYTYIFETPPPADTEVMRLYEKAPHPFILEPPMETRQQYGPGDELSFHVILIGRAINYLPYFIYTFDVLGQKGIGRGRGKFTLKSVAADEKGIEKIIYESVRNTVQSFPTNTLSFEQSSDDSTSQQTVTLEFLTPTRIVYKGKLLDNLQFHILIRGLLRRISLLGYFHCGSAPDSIDFRKLIEQAREVKVKHSRLSWYDWQRYSARQDTMMKLGGFVDSITFEGKLSEFMPCLLAGEILHVGKGTGFGLGKYKIIKGG